MKFSVIVVIFAAALAWLLFDLNKVSIIDTAKHIDAPVTNETASMIKPRTQAPLSSETDIKQDISDAGSKPDTSVVKSHLDHLSPEMKQALKDTLFHHGPKTITEDSHGRVRLNQAGRYVNMPVAVRKADGTIEIKEYSVIPDTSTVTAQ
ncbi:hypothetical protein ACU6U9_20040 [Pseudomonas sp. HK3]